MQWTRFNTSHGDVADAIEEWRRFISHSLIGVECRASGHSEFQAGCNQIGVDDLGVTQIACSAHSVRRSQAMADQAENDHILVLVQRSGAAEIRHCGRSVVVGPGAAFVFDPAYAHDMSFESEIDQLMFRVGKSQLARCGLDASGYGGFELDCERDGGKTFKTLAMALCDEASNVHGYYGYRLLSIAGDLLIDQLRRRARPEWMGDSPSRRRHLSEIKLFIERRLCEPDLSPEMVAAAHHVSRRYLDKLFTENSTTASKWISERRVSRAAWAFIDAERARTPISAIAFEVGFNDLSYFNRLFRQRYGVTPSQYRRNFADMPPAKPSERPVRSRAKS